MNAHRIEIVLSRVLLASLILAMLAGSPPVFSSHEEKVNSEGGSSNPVLYDSWNDLTNSLKRRAALFAFAEIREVEVKEDAVIITANATMQDAPELAYYFIFFDTNLDNKTDTCWGLDRSYNSKLFRYSDKAFYYSGSWHPFVSSAQAGQFDGTVSENATSGETAFHLGGVINGTMKIKVASMAKYDAFTVSLPWEGDLVPGGNFTSGAKLYMQPPYMRDIKDAAFPYGNTTVKLEAGEPPLPPPPPRPKVHVNLFVQMAVWGMQGALWIKEGIINLPFWIRDNVVSGGLVITAILLSSYSSVKKHRTSKQRFKRLQAQAE